MGGQLLDPPWGVRSSPWEDSSTALGGPVHPWWTAPSPGREASQERGLGEAQVPTQGCTRTRTHHTRTRTPTPGYPHHPPTQVCQYLRTPSRGAARGALGLADQLAGGSQALWAWLRPQRGLEGPCRPGYFPRWGQTSGRPERPELPKELNQLA